VVNKQKILLFLQHQIQVVDPAERDMFVVQQQIMQNLVMALDCQAHFLEKES